MAKKIPDATKANEARHVLGELAKRRLASFCDYTGEGQWKSASHLDVLCEKIEEAEEWINGGHDEIKLIMVSLPPRHGKLCADSTPVLTTGGWKTHGDLCVGDQVFSVDGKPTPIVAVSPSGEANYEVLFTNGEAIKCHGLHEWTVYDRGRFEWRTVETEYLASQSVWSGNRARFQLPDIALVEYPETELPMNPYVLGVWLGDGTSTAPNITMTEEDGAFIVDRLEKAGYKVHAKWIHPITGVPTFSFAGDRRGGHRNGGRMTRELNEMGLRPRGQGKRSREEKHIPEHYQRSSVSQRLFLLAGLIDTDGSVDKKGRVRFTTGDKRLAMDVIELCTGLAFRPYVRVIEPCLSTSGFQGRKPIYVVGFQPNAIIPTALPRKSTHITDTRRRVGIKSVTRVEAECGKCIQVDRSDGLYLVGRKLIPTHNSEVVSRNGPAWFLGRNPDKEVIITSYGASLATDMSRDARRIFKEYAGPLFGLELAQDTKSVALWNVEGHKGKVQASGAGGPITGRGSSLAIVDDPSKNMEEAESPTHQRKLLVWFKTTLLPRMAPGAAIVLVASRWHEKDLPGQLLEEAKETGLVWDVVRFPAIATDDDVIGRHKGDALWPSRYPIKRLMQLKKALSSVRLWVGCYQQAPVGDVQGALWKLGLIEALRVGGVPQLFRIVISWDPATTSKKTSDAHGIIVVATGIPYYHGGERPKDEVYDKHGYVLEDLSGIYTPDQALNIVVNAYERLHADKVIAEANQGGDMIEALLRTKKQYIAYKKITASESKRGRAEPVEALYEQRLIHHVGNFPQLEKEQTTWTGPPMASPNSLDALVHGLADLFDLNSPLGKQARVLW